jgi:UDP-N-acetylglucosamine/UDP-N-acetylgalactosamine 4-epimerase
MFSNILYNSKYHNIDFSNYSFLVTGGAGFIGSNLVEYLLKYGAKKVRILDNLSTGSFENLVKFKNLSQFEFINGDIRDLNVCINAVSGIDFVSHQAALGSVPRSIKDPLMTNDVNVNGFLNMLVACSESKSCKKMVYAASSSTYGDSVALPKVEGKEGKPISPYAVSKAVNEMYANVFSEIYNLDSIGLRYFNVFGPKQSFDNAYSAVIPKFCKSVFEEENLIIFGDGETSRDFTFIENIVQANVLAFEYRILNLDNTIIENGSINNFKHEVFNVACGEQISLNQVVDELKKISGKNIHVIYNEERQGDIKHSKASIDKIARFLNYKPYFNFHSGLDITYQWFSENFQDRV